MACSSLQPCCNGLFLVVALLQYAFESPPPPPHAPPPRRRRPGGERGERCGVGRIPGLVVATRRPFRYEDMIPNCHTKVPYNINCREIPIALCIL